MMMKKPVLSLFATLLVFHLTSNLGSAQMTHIDSLNAHYTKVTHRNDSIRLAHTVVIDSIFSGGKYYPVTSTDIYTHDEKIEEKEIINCPVDSICKTINVKRKEAEEIEIEFPTNKLAGKIIMYEDLRLTTELVSAKFPANEDYIELSFSNLDDGTYLFKLERADRTYYLKLIIRTTKFWK